MITRTISIAALALLMVVTAAQKVSAQQGELRFGARASFNLAQVSGDQLFDGIGYQTLYSGGGGLLANYQLCKRVAIQTEIGYSGKGYRINKLVQNGTETMHYEGTGRFGYLDIPVLAQLKFGRLQLEAGPQVSLLLGEHVEDILIAHRRSGPQAEQENVTSFVSSDKRNFSPAVVSMAGGVHVFLTQNLSVGGRYVAGLSNFTRNTGRDLRHREMQFAVTYYLPVRGYSQPVY